MVKWPEKNKPYFDLKPTVIPDFFTKSQYDGLYKLIGDHQLVEKQLNKPMGYFATNIYMEEPWFSIMLKKVNEHYKIDTQPDHCMFVYNRYTWKTGFPPTLKPHFDTMTGCGSITLSIILDTTLDWNIIAEDEEFKIKSNEAFLFSGTHHLHWRPKIDFGPDDYYDFLLCQFIDMKPLMIENDEEYWNIMVENRSEKSTDWWRQYESGQVQ